MGKAFKTFNMITIIITALLLIPIFNTIRSSSSTANMIINILHVLVYVASLVFLILERIKNKLAIHVTSLIVSAISFNIFGVVAAIIGIVTRNKTEIIEEKEEIENQVINEDSTPKLVIGKGSKILFIISIIVALAYIALYVVLISIFYLPTLPDYFKSIMDEKTGWAFWNLFLCLFYGCIIFIVLLIPIHIFILIIGNISLTLKKRHFSLFITNIVLGFMFLTIFNAIASIITLVNNKEEKNIPQSREEKN